MQEISSKLPRDLASVTINFEAAKGSYMSLMRSTTSWLSEKDTHKPLLPNTRNWHEMSSKISETSGLALRCPFKFASPNTRVTDNMPSTRGRSPEYIHIYTSKNISTFFTLFANAPNANAWEDSKQCQSFYFILHKKTYRRKNISTFLHYLLIMHPMPIMGRLQSSIVRKIRVRLV